MMDKGLKQGDGLSCLLFNIALEKIIRNAKLENKGTIYSKSIQILAYADDIDIVGRTINSVKEACLALSKAASNMELTINEEKTKFMQVTSKPLMISELIVGEQKFEVVLLFKYLGTIVTNDNNLLLDKEIRYRISLANNCYHRLKHLFRSQFLNLRTKLNLYKTLLKPVLIYGREC